MANEQRYLLLGDDSGHHYFVPVGLENIFEEWVESFSDEQADGFKYNGPDFEANRIDGQFTFTDPRCE